MSEKPPIDVVLEALGAELPPLPETGYAKVKCFHHSEDNASATVNKEKGLYKCFVCSDISGDAYAVVMAVMGTDFVGAKSWIEETIGFVGHANEREPVRPERRTSLHISSRGAGADRRNPQRASTRRRRRLR